MPYYRKDDQGNVEESPVKITLSDDYKEFYSHGAQGGILGSYHYRVDFYRDQVPPFGERELDGKIISEQNEIIREIGVSVYLSLPFAKQLRDWLDENIKKFEKEEGEIKVVASD